MICDVDELILHEEGMAIPDILANISEPVLQFKRRQIIEVESCNEYSHLPRMHCLTHLYEEEKPLEAPKYAFMPSKISPDTHLLVHHVIGDKMHLSNKVLGRHFGSLRLHWRNNDFSPINLRMADSYKTNLLEDKQLKDSFKLIDINWL